MERITALNLFLHSCCQTMLPLLLLPLPFSALPGITYAQTVPTADDVIISSNPQSYNASSQILTDPFPFDFPRLDSEPVDLFPMPLCHGFTLEEATIDQLQDAMGKGELTSVQIVECYLKREQQIGSYVK